MVVATAGMMAAKTVGQMAASRVVRKVAWTVSMKAE